MFAPDEGAKQSQEEVIGEELNADAAESCSDKERKMSGFSESETGGLGGIQSGELAIQLSHQRPCLPPGKASFASSNSGIMSASFSAGASTVSASVMRLGFSAPVVRPMCSDNIA